MTVSSHKPKQVLVFSPYALWTFHTVYEGTIAKACRVRGAEVSYLACDGLLECDQHWFSKAGGLRPDDICQRCRAANASSVGLTEFPSHLIGSFLSQGEKDEVSSWTQALCAEQFGSATFRGMPLGEWVISSINSYFRQFPPDLTSELVVGVYRNFLISAGLVAIALTNYLEANEVDSAIVFNGRQSITRVAMEVFLARGIRVLTHERGEYQRGHLNARANAHCMSPLPFQSFWRTWGSIPLSREQLEQARMWLVERRYGVNPAWIQFSKGMNSLSVRRQLGISQGKPFLVLFTSSTDEVAGDPLMKGPYSSQADWVTEVVEWTRDHEQVDLVIKVHPNLGGNSYIGAARQELGIYEEMRSTLPANVRMVMPEDNVSAYSLAEEADFGLTFGSIIGLEMAMYGKPVLLASRASYEHADAFLTVRSRQDLPGFLEKSLHPFDTREIQRQAFRIAYYAMCVCDMPFPLVMTDTIYGARENFQTAAELAHGKDPSLDRICRFLIEEGPLFENPTPKDLARTNTEEDSFLEELSRSPDSFREKHIERWLRLRSIGQVLGHILERLPFGAGQKLVQLSRPRWHTVLKSIEVGRMAANSK
jgi:hypothetical protein